MQEEAPAPAAGADTAVSDFTEDLLEALTADDAPLGETPAVCRARRRRF